jgi:hypothetical protein
MGWGCAGLGLLTAVLAGPAAAHPHVFIDTRVMAVLDAEGRVTAIRLRWDYDTLVSMVVIEDKGADADGDGVISAAEAQVLDGFDMTWAPGFEGDTMAFQGEAPVALVPGPQDWATGWVGDDAGGHLWSEHTRKLVAPLDPGAGQVRVVVYDVTDYTAYALTGAGLVEEDGAVPKDCRIAPPAEAPEEGGLFTTVGLFLFGRDDGAEVSVLPGAAAGRAVVDLDCP